MKGVAHFAIGVATASCFPEAVAAGAAGNPLYFILGGAFGLLPDTLDFKFYRFLFPRDIEVVPDPLAPNPGRIAQGIAEAVVRAHANGQPVRVKLNTVRVGSDAWQTYRVRFDRVRKRVAVSFGAVVDTGGQPVDGETGLDVRRASAWVELPLDVSFDYQAETTVDIFDGPTLEMRPEADGRVGVRFIPWHRQWSHSLVLAALLGGLASWVWGLVAGMVVAAAFGAHVLADQMGFMGSNLLFPFTRRRTMGFMLMHSTDALPNATAVWLSCLIVFWNLYRHSSANVPPLGAVPLFLFGGILPLALLAYLGRRLRGGVRFL